MINSTRRLGEYSVFGGLSSISATNVSGSLGPLPFYAIPSAPAATAATSGLRLKVPLDVWLKTMRFEGLSQFQTLDMVLDGVKRAMQRYHRNGGQKPVVVFDLDDTLFRSNQTRTHRILREWLDEKRGLPANVREALAAVRPDRLAYDSKDTFTKVAGLSLEDPAVKAAYDDFVAFWKDRFFSDAYCAEDSLNFGAEAFARAVHDLGASIAYVTGRDEERMGKGTRRSIINGGLPRLSSRVKLFLKPDKDMDDAKFKESVKQQINAMGQVVATFDNAPANVVVFRDSFPNAINVFFDTVYPNSPVELRDGVFRIYDFSRRVEST
jgi:hypothetical protein